ncbi:MAG: CPBP family glutamic-type intramembrane protease [Planctomycetota bacterium]|jgi:membrane protease YdiL (CAAX protease family)
MSSEAKSVCVKFAAAFVVTVILAPMLAAWVLPDERWHRVTTRTFLGAVILIFSFSAGHPRHWIEKLRGLGLDGPQRGERVFLGIVVSSILFIVLVLAEVVLGGRGMPLQPPKRPLSTDLARAMFTAFNVSIIEEILCRGYLKSAIGGTMSALLYAGAHYFRPMHRTAPADGYDPLLVFRRFPELLEGWTVPNHFTFGLLSLFLFGLALNKLRDRTGTLYVGMGIHFGVVMGLKLYGRAVGTQPLGSPMVWGSSRMHDGLIGFLVMLALLVWAYRGRVPTAETQRLPAT